MSERLTIKVDGGVADVRLNRPDKLNGIDEEMFKGLDAIADRIAGEAGVRCVVLSGEGRSFCAGLDFGSFMAGGGEVTDLLARESGALTNLVQRAAEVWMSMPIPVIAAVSGHCYGGGLQIALGADIRLIAPDAKVSVMEMKWGLIPDMTGTQTLSRLVRLDVAKELTYTGRVIDGTEAARLGLATRVSENPFDDAMALANEIASKSPDAIRAAKAVLDASHDLNFAEGLLHEEKLQRGLLGSPNQIEAVTANFEKRAPEFTDPT